MASYNELNALIDAYINRNGVQAITGQILNGVLKAMVEQLGRGYTIMGAALPTTDPGTPDGPECYFASTPGTYTDFDGLQIVSGELALLCYTPSDGWTKETIYEGFQEVQATIDENVGTPSVGVSYANGVLSFDFHNMKGNPGQNGQDGQDGDAAGFGTIGADITGGVGTPGVTVESSGPATAKNLQFHFTNLKGETGVTSVVATVDNTTGTPTCTVSLVGQQLTLAFSGLKGAQGDTGSSVDYPFTIVNNLTTNDATQALSAAMGVELAGQVSQLEQKVNYYTYLPILPGIDFDDISGSISTGAVYFTSYQLVLKYLENGGTLKVDYLIFKPYPGDATVEVFKMTVDENNIAVAGPLAKTITLDNAWLDESYGTGVYKIPYDGLIDYIPCFNKWCQNTGTTGNGWQATGQSVTGTSADHTKSIGGGILSVDVSSSVKDKLSDLDEDVTELASDISDLENAQQDLDERLEKVESDTQPKTEETSILPGIAFDNITTNISSGTTVFASWQMVLKYVENNGSLKVDFLVFKPYPGDTSVNIYKMTVVDNIGVEGELAKTIELDASWLDESYGTGVYKIPYDGLIDYIPSVTRFCVNTQTGGNGYFAEGQSVLNNPDRGKSIALGMITRTEETVNQRITVLESKTADLDERVTALEGEEAPILSGKKIGFLGDSITQGAQYVNAFQTLSGCTAVNYGIAATHIAKTGTAYDNTYHPFEDRVSGLANDLDGIVVFGGTNDFGHTNTAPFGTFDDYTDEDIISFYAGCHRMCKQLYDKFRGKPIIIMTPIHHGYEVDAHEYNFNVDGTISAGVNPTTGKTFKEYVDAIKQVAQYYSFVVIDAFSESGLNPCLETSDARYYFSDGLHLTQAGGDRLAHYMLPQMEKIFKSF